jgi:GNAT superfamily N-acetyltransferase
MYRVHSVDTVDDFFLPGDSGDFKSFLTHAVEDGDTQPDWCFVIEDDGQTLGRVGFTLEPSTSNPEWLGTLPATELHPFGLQWDGRGEVLEALLVSALPRLSGLGPDHVEFRVNRRSTPHASGVVATLEGLGAPLFQEKAGFELEAARTAAMPTRLEWSTVTDVGVDRYADIMARCGDGTLDRNDRYYWSHCGGPNWGRQMMEYLDPDDADMWLIGSKDGRPVGYVFVTTDRVLVSTIGHIGVVPEARGNGYIHDLLAAAEAAIANRGIYSMLSDVDVLNQPMIDAMRTAGHRDSEWHVWHYRPSV